MESVSCGHVDHLVCVPDDLPFICFITTQSNTVDLAYFWYCYNVLVIERIQHVSLLWAQTLIGFLLSLLIGQLVTPV